MKPKRRLRTSGRDGRDIQYSGYLCRCSKSAALLAGRGILSRSSLKRHVLGFACWMAPSLRLIAIVLISGKEEPEATLSPPMDAIIRVFKRVNGLPENDGDKATGAALLRLLVASTQAISLIGIQGSLIKSIQETSGASVRVLSNDEIPSYASSDERVVEIQGEAVQVLKALEAVVSHLRKFLVDQSILPLFEKSHNAPATQERQVDTWSGKMSLHQTPQTSLGVEYPSMLKRDSLFLGRECQIESHNQSSRIPLYGQEHGLGNRSSMIGRPAGPFVTQIVLCRLHRLCKYLLNMQRILLVSRGQILITFDAVVVLF